MLKLINIELIKIFHKKSIYIILTIMLLFCILNNYLYYKDYNQEGFYKYLNNENLEEKINLLTKELKQQDKTTTKYISTQTEIDILNIKKSFSKDSWQYNLINDILYDTIYQINQNKYIEKNETKLNELQKTYTEKKNKLYQNNWQYFIKEEIEKNKNELNQLKNEVSTDVIKEKIKEKEETINILQYRLNNNIKNEQTYLNIALEKVIETEKIIKDLKDKPKSKEEKITLQNAISENKINKYILKTKQNINKENTVNNQLRTIAEDYEIFLVILILITSSAIICEEFGKGTIKLLLIKPYSRGKILLSKYLTCLIVLVISIIYLIIIQLIIGIPLFGIDSLKLPIVIYNSNQLKEYSVFTYMFIRIIAKIPFYLMVETMAFTLSIYFTNTAISITVPMLIYMLDTAIINITNQSHTKILKYLINNHWHFEKYLFNNNIIDKQLEKSILIWITYFIVLQLLMIIHFKRKNIRNI